MISSKSKYSDLLIDSCLVMTMSADERDRRLCNNRKAAKDTLLKYYSKQFSRAMNEFEAAFSRGDAMTTANTFMTATAINNLLKDIEKLPSQR